VGDTTDMRAPSISEAREKEGTDKHAPSVSETGKGNGRPLRPPGLAHASAKEREGNSRPAGEVGCATALPRVAQASRAGQPGRKGKEGE
jgi:hypothetical protein